MDIQRPHDDPFGLVGDNWVQESESAYTTAELSADDAGSSAASQARVAVDAASKMVDEKGHTADSVSGAYGSLAGQLLEQSRHFTTIAAWMTDTASEIRGTKKHIASLVATGTSEIKDALTSELQGTPVTPSSNALITQYQGDIARVKTKLETDLDAIGHSLAGTPGSSHTPSYVSVPTSPTTERPNPTAEVAAYNHGQAPAVQPQQLPEMPRATPAPATESPSGAGAPSTSTSSAPHPTLAHLIGGQGGTPTGAPTTGSPHASSPNTGASSTQSHQPTEQHQTSKAPALPHIPSLPLDGLPAAAAESVATVVSAAAGHQLSTAAQGTITSSTPASTGFTPGAPGTPPVTPMTPAPLTPIGGGGLSAPAVQPAPQATAPPPAPQQTTTTPSPTRSPAADLSWIQRTYGLAPGVELPKPETLSVPARFITDVPESEAHLHRALASLRQQFEQAGWGQPLAVALIRKGFESRCVYVTADALSIHPHGVSLPHGVTPLDEMPGAPVHPELSGSLMVTDKIKSLIPRGWEVQSMLSTLPADENHQSPEQYQELVGAGELLPCKVSRGRDGVEAGEAMSTFARAAIGSAGCSELDTESSRLKAARWVGMQPVDYLGLLGRWYLADAAASMSDGRWAEAVYSAEKYLSVVDTKRQVA
ncbi:hypothetical protein [Mycobacteroides abscessus]|uniref:hypothetical protein n=1 Tax=Mycobacteroides abscessus TaxID=36809 RepID=UPI0009267E36|nr:hypothetical protein [Mycobacteroides abscessus]SIF22601.1 Uncharacterised protein [Mycobacteroides abscessus subsp. abscessus]SIG35059.1 Uncharacterised protein [Mycobacteroides abscessus subsp. abscessus]SIG51753.1 Uncharacterised protein [Mycobacteroides abscessus subsp. abscessus]SIG82177.1 Uncharacterised protein [Mycobacteroides abscessus subsp. abscessus]